MTQNWKDLLQTDDPGFAWEALQDAIKAEAESATHAKKRAWAHGVWATYDRVAPLMDAAMNACIKATNTEKHVIRDHPIALIFAAAMHMSCVKEAEGGRFDRQEAERVLTGALDMAILLTDAIVTSREDRRGK